MLTLRKTRVENEFLVVQAGPAWGGTESELKIYGTVGYPGTILHPLGWGFMKHNTDGTTSLNPYSLTKEQMTIARIMSGNMCKILRYQRRTLPSDLHDFYSWESVKLKLQKHWPHGPHAGTLQ